ncbi:MAG: hypothetical protein ABIL52_02815 [candidate division WOR-3 bacterium]
MYRDNNNYILDSYFGIGILNRFAFILDYSRYTSFNVLTSILRVIPKRGFHLLISYDFSDENNEKMRLGGGFSIFYNPYLEIMSRYYYYFEDKYKVLAFSFHIGF